MLIKAKSIEGYSLHGLDGAFGKVRDLYFDDARWTIRYLVVDTMNWMEDRAVLISPYALIGLYAGKKLIRTSLTMKQIEESPSAKTDEPVSMQFEESYHAFFGWPDYWRGSSVWGDSAIIARRPEERRNENQGGKPWDHHLRSVSAVVGYGIHARDGELGHVEDFIFDSKTWTIRYLVVDTKSLLPGKKVLISPKWIVKVSWEESKVFLDISSEAVSLSPTYSEQTLLDRDYEEGLQRHFERVD